MKSPLMLLFSFLLFEGCFGQSKDNQIYNSVFNWTITIPEGFKSVSAEQWEKMQNKGASAIEKTYGQEIVNRAKTILVFSDGPTNYFESNYQPFDEHIDGDYVTSCKGVGDILYGTFASQLPKAKIDSARSTEKIDGLVFQKFKIKITIPGKLVMYSLMYSRLFDKNEFAVNILYVDEAKGQQMINSWQTSTFARK